MPSREARRQAPITALVAETATHLPRVHPPCWRTPRLDRPWRGCRLRVAIVLELTISDPAAQQEQPAVLAGREGVGPAGAGVVAEAIGQVVVGGAESVAATEPDRRGRCRLAQIGRVHRTL